MGHKGMYSAKNIDALIEAGFKYILGLEWHEQREQLLARAPEQLGLLDEVGILEWEDNGIRREIARQELLDGKYVLETTVSREKMDAKKVRGSYQSLKYAERNFRHINSFLDIRPMYHRRRWRIKAHVLICFLAYYLVKQCEFEFRAKGETREVEEILRYWDKLRLSQHVPLWRRTP